MTRPPTAAETNAASVAESHLRWRSRTAAQIFPATVPYSDELAHDKRSAHRIGIAPAAKCAQALDREIAAMLDEHGCVTVLRSTYVDQTGTLLMAVGVAVMPDEDSADAAESAIQGMGRHLGVHPAAFPGTVAGRFGDHQRQMLGVQTNHTSYLLLSAEGWADGRPEVKEGDLVEDFGFSHEILTAVSGNFVANGSPCQTKEVQC
jgi:hypothetical protein